MTGTTHIPRRMASAVLLMLVASCMIAGAQERRTYAGELRLGVIGGANWNYVPIQANEYIEAPEGSTFPSSSFPASQAYAPFFGVQADYDFRPIIGFHVRLTYDERNISNRDAGGARLDARLSYLSLEPAIRLTNSAATRIFLMAGPSLHLNLGHSYDFMPSDLRDTPIHDAEIEYVNPVILGAWTNIGMDIPISVDPRGIGWYLSPVFEASYLFNQITYEEDEDEHDPTAPEEEYNQWTTVTFRGAIGVKYSFGW
jgi:hypothetical protein